jgi:ribonuclease HII
VVVVTATIGRVPQGLRDSKLLTPAAREQLVAPVRRWAGEWAVGHASAAEIDAFGIMTALRMAGHRAIAALSAPVDAVLLDGNHDYLNASRRRLRPDDAEPAPALFGDPTTGADWPRVPVHVRIKADLRCAGVAAASVLAKTERDRLMTAFDSDYPAYGWGVNKGYATPEHLGAIAEHGPCEEHRRSWRLTGPVVGDDGGVGDDEWIDGAADPELFDALASQIDGDEVLRVDASREPGEGADGDSDEVEDASA